MDTLSRFPCFIGLRSYLLRPLHNDVFQSIDCLKLVFALFGLYIIVLFLSNDYWQVLQEQFISVMPVVLFYERHYSVESPDDIQANNMQLLKGPSYRCVGGHPLVVDSTLISNQASGGQVGAIFVDYIQKIHPQKPQNPRYLDIKLVSELLLQQAVTLNVPILLGAQLSRADSNQGSKRVRLENLRESGDIEQDASLVIGLYNASVDRREESGQEDQEREVDMELIILKNRGGGSVNRSIVLTFDRPTLRLKDRDPSKFKANAY